ncbi:MAG: hypothetical protein Q8O64_14690 [Sideroxyarcus sp.]|nr:hypothetical protein [Sideroxyarcus sp.]
MIAEPGDSKLAAEYAGADFLIARLQAVRRNSDRCVLAQATLDQAAISLQAEPASCQISHDTKPAAATKRHSKE